LLKHIQGAIIQARYMLMIGEECFVTRTDESYKSDEQQANCQWLL